MSEASSSKAKKAAPAAEEVQQPKAPFKPAKFGLYERQVVDYVRTATAHNVWYYRCALAWKGGRRSASTALAEKTMIAQSAMRGAWPTKALPPLPRRDRMSSPRGPCSLPVMREAWVHGVIDENTLVWGQGLADWLPVRNVRTLVPQIRTLEGV